MKHACVMEITWNGTLGQLSQTGFRGTSRFRKGVSGVPRDENA